MSELPEQYRALLLDPKYNTSRATGRWLHREHGPSAQANGRRCYRVVQAVWAAKAARPTDESIGTRRARRDREEDKVCAACCLPEARAEAAAALRRSRAFHASSVPSHGASRVAPPLRVLVAIHLNDRPLSLQVPRPVADRA